VNTVDTVNNRCASSPSDVSQASQILNTRTLTAKKIGTDPPTTNVNSRLDT